MIKALVMHERVKLLLVCCVYARQSEVGVSDIIVCSSPLDRGRRNDWQFCAIGLGLARRSVMILAVLAALQRSFMLAMNTSSR